MIQAVIRLPWLLILISGVSLAGATVTDDTGREVSLAQPARRIVTLAPHATELLLTLGLESRLVAVSEFFDYPPAIDNVPRLSSLGGIDRERLLTLNPDLVIAWASGNRWSDIQWLEDTGIPVYLSEPESLDEIAVSLAKLGRLAGTPQRGEQAAKQFLQQLDRSCAHRKNQPPINTYYEIWPTPPMTIGARHWLNKVLSKAALRNIFADLPRGVVVISRESLLARDHDLVIKTVARGEKPSAGKRVVMADPVLGRPGPRILEGLERLCVEL